MQAFKQAAGKTVSTLGPVKGMLFIFHQKGLPEVIHIQAGMLAFLFVYSVTKRLKVVLTFHARVDPPLAAAWMVVGRSAGWFFLPCHSNCDTHRGLPYFPLPMSHLPHLPAPSSTVMPFTIIGYNFPGRQGCFASLQGAVGAVWSRFEASQSSKWCFLGQKERLLLVAIFKKVFHGITLSLCAQNLLLVLCRSRWGTHSS